MRRWHKSELGCITSFRRRWFSTAASTVLCHGATQNMSRVNKGLYYIAQLVPGWTKDLGHAFPNFLRRILPVPRYILSTLAFPKINRPGSSTMLAQGTAWVKINHLTILFRYKSKLEKNYFKLWRQKIPFIMHKIDHPVNHYNER